MTPRRLITRDWLEHLSQGPIGIGLDLATTEKKTSNPSSLTVSQTDGKLVMQRLIVRWKTSDDRITKAVVRAVFEDLVFARKKARAMSFDASSEAFLGAQLIREFTKFAPIRPIKSGETVEWKGEELTYKALLGNLYSGLFEDALIGIPEGAWIIEDHRLVMQEKGSFYANLGPNGEHGDTFDSGKLSYWSLVRTGRAEIHAADITQAGKAGQVAKGLKNWLAQKCGVALPNSQGSSPFVRTPQSSRRLGS